MHEWRATRWVTGAHRSVSTFRVVADRIYLRWLQEAAMKLYSIKWIESSRPYHNRDGQHSYGSFCFVALTPRKLSILLLDVLSDCVFSLSEWRAIFGLVAHFAIARRLVVSMGSVGVCTGGAAR